MEFKKGCWYKLTTKYGHIFYFKLKNIIDDNIYNSGFNLYKSFNGTYSIYEEMEDIPFTTYNTDDIYKEVDYEDVIALLPTNHFYRIEFRKERVKRLLYGRI